MEIASGPQTWHSSPNGPKSVFIPQSPDILVITAGLFEVLKLRTRAVTCHGFRLAGIKVTPT